MQILDLLLSLHGCLPCLSSRRGERHLNASVSHSHPALMYCFLMSTVASHIGDARRIGKQCTARRAPPSLSPRSWQWLGDAMLHGRGAQPAEPPTPSA